MKNKLNILSMLIRYFLKGVLTIIPFAFTVYVIALLLKKLDGIIKLSIPGLGIAITLAGITLIGYLGSLSIIKSSLEKIEYVILKIPLINILYSSFKEFILAFLGNKKKFNIPVLINMSNSPVLQKIGFITQDTLKGIDINDSIAVYAPHSYAFSGDLYITKKENVVLLNISSSEAMKFVVSGGVTKPQKFTTSKI
jgi:uncharacterized membrane protein